MQTEPETLEERMARLEGQYHALSKELTDNFKSIQDTLNNVQKQVDDMHTVKGGLLKSETLSDVLKRMDDQLQQVSKQVVAISNNLQIDQSKIR